jgi:penicillin-binding protein 1A
MIKKVVKVLWIFIALITLTCVVIFFSIAKGWIGYMPPVEDLENPNIRFCSPAYPTSRSSSKERKSKVIE